MPKYIEDLNEETNPSQTTDTTSDWLWMVDSSASTDKDKKVSVGRFARTDVNSNFSANQTITKVNALLTLNSTSGAGQINIGPADNGTSIGARIILDRNTNSQFPAAGHVRMINAGGSAWHIWPENTVNAPPNIANLRIGNSIPTSSNDLSGTIVGSQASHESFKFILGEASPIDVVMNRLSLAMPHIQKFAYYPEELSPNREIYEGLILRENSQETHYYGTDKYEEGFSAGKSLNIINVCGDLMRAVVHLHERVLQLEAKLNTSE